MECTKGRKWDNCNSIINKYIFKKSKKKNLTFIKLQLCQALCRQNYISMYLFFRERGREGAREGEKH